MMIVKRIVLGVAIVLSMANGFAQKQRLDSVVSHQKDKYIFSYDNNGNQTMEIHYTWNNDWVEHCIYEYTYGNSGNRTTSIFYVWNNTANDRKEFEKEEYTYGNDGNQTRKVYYRWDSTVYNWKEYSNNEYTYDSNGNPTSMINYNWDTTANDWGKNSKREYTYDSNGNLTMEILYVWDSFSDTGWVDLMIKDKYEYAYDNNRNPTMVIHYRWEYTAKDFKKYTKYDYTYDNNGNQTMYIYYRWSDGDNDWGKVWKTEYTYDQSYSRMDLIMPIGFNSVNMLTGYVLHIWSGTDWTEDEFATYYWSAKNVGIVETDNYPSLRVYPNPKNGQIHIECRDAINRVSTEEYTICNLIGQVVMRGVLPCRDAMHCVSTINVESLVNGMYYLKIADRVVKFVKE